MPFIRLMRKYSFQVLVPLFLLFSFLGGASLAHHPFGMGNSSELSVLQALASGIGHPLLGPDHLLFLLGITLIGLKKTKNWILPLLAIGLVGSAFVQYYPLPDSLAPWAEAFVSLSLAIEGLIALNLLSSKWLLPMFTCHGYLLGSTIVGAEPSPLIGYFFGLLLAQGSLLLLATASSQKVINRFGMNGRTLFAGIWIGIGLAFSWVALVP